VRVGRLMAAASVHGGLENVAINLESIHDSSYVSEMKSRSADLEGRVRALL